MEKEEVQKQIVEIIDKLLDSYHDGIYGNGMQPDVDEESMIRISHEIITLYRVLDLFRE